MSECVFFRCPQCECEGHFNTDDAETTRQLAGNQLDEQGILILRECLVCGLGGVKRSADIGGYFVSELAQLKDEVPAIGHLCSHCGFRIPRFLDLKPQISARARQLARDNQKIQAIQEIHSAIGCSLSWAKIWIEHPNGPIVEVTQKGPPCPYCRKPLRPELAKQCLECGMDWHDPRKVQKLGSG